jgi:tetratricopeptide (TPR) repeat protein
MSTPADSIAAAIAAFHSGNTSRTISIGLEALATSDGPVLRHLLGVAYCRNGDPATGIAHLARAAELRPRDPQILLMLMRALIDAGRPNEALAVAFTAEGLPAAAVAALWRARAEAAHAAADAGAEAEALRCVVELEPRDDRARDLLIHLLIATDRAEDALAQTDALPPSRDRQRHRSAALIALRRFDEVTAIDSALLASDPGDRATWLSALLLADRLRDGPRLSALVEHARAGAYLEAEINFARALDAKHGGRFEQALAQAQASAVTGDPARAPALAAALADRLGRADEAMAAAIAKSAATPDREQWIRRGAAHRAQLGHLLDTMTPNWASAWPKDHPGDRAAPTFLVGFPRSGTTLLDTFLMGHPGVTVIEEENMLDLAGRELGDQANLHRVDDATVARARAAYFAALDPHLTKDGKPRLVIDKLPLAMTGVPVIKRLFPDARIIFAMRHPADCVLSSFLQAFRLNDAMANFLHLDDAARFYDVAMQVWERAAALLGVDRHVVVYEELVADPEAVLRPLIAWLGLDWSDDLLDHRATASRRQAIVTPSYDQVTQPLHRRAAGRWRNYSAYLEPVRTLLEPWAIRHGYGPMGQ